MKSSWPRDWTCVPCIGRQILIYCTTREVLSCYFELNWLGWMFLFEHASGIWGYRACGESSARAAGWPNTGFFLESHKVPWTGAHLQTFRCPPIHPTISAWSHRKSWSLVTLPVSAESSAPHQYFIFIAGVITFVQPYLSYCVTPLLKVLPRLPSHLLKAICIV